LALSSKTHSVGCIALLSGPASAYACGFSGEVVSVYPWVPAGTGIRRSSACTTDASGFWLSVAGTGIRLLPL